MHVHGSYLDPVATNLYFAVAAEKAAEAKRAADVRNKLSAAAYSGCEIIASGVSMIDQGSKEGSRQPQEKKRPYIEKKKAVVNEAPQREPVSFWG